MSVTLHSAEKSGRNRQAFQKMLYGSKDTLTFTVSERIPGIINPASAETTRITDGEYTA